MEFADSMQNLKLSFCLCKQVTDAGAALLASHLPGSLTDLYRDFALCSSLILEGIEWKLADSVQSLKLSFCRSRRVTDAGELAGELGEKCSSEF